MAYANDNEEPVDDLNVWGNPLDENFRKFLSDSGVPVWSNEDYLELLKISRVRTLSVGCGMKTELLEGSSFRLVVKTIASHFRFSFHAEVRALCHMRGLEGVQQIEAVCLESSHLMMVSHYAGETLGSMADRLSQLEVDAIITQLRGSLRRIHDAGFVHDDLHLSNVCVLEGPLGPRVTVIDFGNSSPVSLSLAYKNNDFLSCYQLELLLSNNESHLWCFWK